MASPARDPRLPPGRGLRILFLTARFPGPGTRGDQVRAYHQLRLLGPRHRITLVSFAPESDASESLHPVAKFVEEIVTVPLPRAARVRNLVRGTFSALPLQVAFYESDRMRRAVADALARDRYDVVQAQLVRMAPYLPTAGPAARVVDLIDALSLNMARRYQYDRTPLRWLAWLEAARLLRYERRLCESVDRAVVCASPDREAIGPFARLATVGNGVDPTEHAFERDGRDPHAIVLSGNMGYFPNVHAARWFAGQVLPRVRRAVPEVTLRIVGARPHRTVRRLAVIDPAVIVVSGFVDRMHSHLRRAGIAVAPLHAGSGQALKVLEAMASGTPVVATPLAAAGVGARHDEHLLVAEGPQAFADQTVRLLRDAALADRLAASARRLVETRHTWEHSVDALEDVYRSAMEERRSRDGGPAFP